MTAAVDPDHDSFGLAGALAGLRRPRLRTDVPILWRTAEAIQIGEDVIVDRVDRSHVAWLTSLDGLTTSTDLDEGLTIAEPDAARLVRAALAAGALDDAARIPGAHRWLSVEDRERAGAVFSAALQTTRCLDSAYAVVDARDRARIGVVGTGAIATAVRDGLATARALAVDGDSAHLLILADAPHPDVPALVEHADLDRPHVHVGVLGARAVVGPLVVPGRTSCLRCAHLHRRDADPSWPLVAVQWAHAVAGMRPPPVDPLLVTLAALHAVAVVRSWVDLPHEPEEWANRAWSLTLPRGEVRCEGRPAHPLCGCRWADS